MFLAQGLATVFESDGRAIGRDICSAERQGRTWPASARERRWTRLQLGTLVLASIVVVFALASASVARGASSSSGATAHGRRQQARYPTRLWSKFPLAAKRSRPAQLRKPAHRALPGAPLDSGRRRTWRPNALLSVLLASAAALLLAAGAVALRGRAAARRPDPTGGKREAEAEPPVQAGTVQTGTAQAAEDDAPGHGHQSDEPPAVHVLFVPTELGYALVERAGDVPPVLDQIEGRDLGIEGRFLVSKVSASPLPRDDRRCAYLEGMSTERVADGEDP
jgi:hypothetical protein